MRYRRVQSRVPGAAAETPVVRAGRVVEQDRRRIARFAPGLPTFNRAISTEFVDQAV